MSKPSTPGPRFLGSKTATLRSVSQDGRSETTTAAAALLAGAIRGDGGHILAVHMENPELSLVNHHFYKWMKMAKRWEFILKLRILFETGLGNYVLSGCSECQTLSSAASKRCPCSQELGVGTNLQENRWKNREKYKQ